MTKKNDKEKLQSRRDFFKNTANKVIPILGIFVAAAPVKLFGSNNDNSSGCVGCTGGCYQYCSGICVEN